ncbi:MAG: NAD(+) diphosphatase [Solobacterium sp.]|nr:NAD(+) diphosphatase [Solobacterium sp.]
MIHDIYPHHFDNRWEPRNPKMTDIVFGYDGNNVILKPDQTFFHYRDLDHRHSFVYLFSIDDTAFFLTEIPQENAISLNINIARNYEPKVLGYACVTGWQLYTWRRTSRFCGSCGTRMIEDQKERAMRCPSCGSLVYPRINPAVIVGIISKDNEILVTQYAIRHGEYRHDALVAGYAEIGETIEDCVCREVMEETGLTVHNLRYYKSQPWSFSGSLLFGFFCDTDEKTIRLDRDELKSAVWKKPEDSFDVPGTASLTSEMIHVFREGGVKYGH